MNLQISSNHFFNLMRIPIYLLDKTGKITFFEDLTIPFKLEMIIEESRKLLINNTDKTTVSRLSDFSKLSFFSFESQDTIIVIGPYLEEEVRSSDISNLMGRLKLIGEEIKLVESFYNQLSVLNNEEIDYIYNMFIASSKIDIKPAIFKSVQSKPIKELKNTQLDNLFVELEYVRHNYDIEDKFSIIIENGDIERASSFPTNEIMKQLPKRALNDSLRNAKTRLTILNTLCTRAAIRGGIDVQLAHQISTNFGILIEAMKSIQDSDIIAKDIIKDYAVAVNNYSLRNYSKLIKNSIILIRQHITEKYTPTNLAEDMYVTLEHLSRSFKKELGITITDYINKSKILEAEKLLTLNDYSISHVSDTLGYTNYSYFTKTFKKYNGLSPSKYKASKTKIKTKNTL